MLTVFADRHTAFASDLRHMLAITAYGKPALTCTFGTAAGARSAPILTSAAASAFLAICLVSLIVRHILYLLEYLYGRAIWYRLANQQPGLCNLPDGKDKSRELVRKAGLT